MANTLLNYVQSDLAKACVMTMQENSVLMGLIPFRNTNGGMTSAYNLIDEFTASTFRDLNENIDGSFVEPRQVVETLHIMTGDVLVDRAFTVGGAGNLVNVQAEQTTIAMKSMANKFENQVLYGDGSAKGFKGLLPRLSDGVGKEFTADTLTMDILDEALDYVSYGAGTKVLIMNSKTKRMLNKVMRASNVTLTGAESFGQAVSVYNGAVIYCTEAVKDSQIFFMNLDETMGICGLTTNGLYTAEMGYQGIYKRTGVEFSVGLKVPHPRCFAVLTIGASATAS